MTETNPNLQLRYHCGEDDKPEHLEWLWEGYILAQNLTILAGPGGKGKTMIACDLGARVTRGDQWPDDAPGLGKPKLVLIYSSEDHWKSIILPRFIAADAERSKLRYIGGPRKSEDDACFSPAENVKELYQDIGHLSGEVGLIIVDPIVDVVKGNMNDANVVRQYLYPWSNLAQKKGIAILGISHLTKEPSEKNQRGLTERILGSGAFTQVARSILIAQESKRHQSRVMRPNKQNYTKEGWPSFCYSTENTVFYEPDDPKAFNVGRVVWGEPVNGSEEEIFGAGAEKDAKDSERKSPAEAFLIRELSGDPRLVTELEELAQAEGISPTQLSYAKREKLRLEDGKLDGKHSYWWMPTAEAEQCTATPS